MDSIETVNLRCSAIVFRNSSVLLLRRDGSDDPHWVLPGGTPRRGESLGSCARREVVEEAGLNVTIERVAFVLEASNQAEGIHRVDIVFTAAEQDKTAIPRQLETGLTPIFYPVDDIGELTMRPPIGGHLRGLHAGRGVGGAYLGGAYLGNLWRPLPSGTDVENISD